MANSSNLSKKIVLAINSLQGAGAERFVLTLGKAFYELGFEVHILCFDPKIEFEFPAGLHYHIIEYKKFRWLPKNTPRYFIFSKLVDRYIKKNIGRPEFILSNLILADRIFSFSKLPNIAYVVHSTLSSQFKFATQPVDSVTGKDTLKKIYEKHPCICVSKGVEADLLANFGSNLRTKVIYNPIDYAKIQIDAEALTLSNEDFIIHLGSFKEAKRHDILLKAYKKTSQKFPLYLMGKGRLQEDVEKLIIELQLQDKVRIMGFFSNPYPYLKQAKGKVLSSDREGFGLVLAEAVALGVPVISTDCYSGPSEILPKNNLLPVNDIEALASKLESLMVNPSQYIVAFNEEFLPINAARHYLDFMQSNVG